MQPWLLWALLGCTLGRHYGVDVLALAWDDVDRARRGLFYVAAGLQGMLLFGVLWHLLPARPVVLRQAVALVCAWAMLEEAQVAACRVAAGVAVRVSAPMWRGLCDQLTGLPVSTVTLALPVLILAWYMDNRRGG